ncbi:MAG TPA: tripartite tricarboxylate transporter substrate binding protein [Ramlibacter sp.]|jgi:tripartite-type tricarboxylate transporter receptor subunit TctC|nr:tripartite tricarboxylate transporter substrate binding protein [Ramlibacter sp.]
MRALKVSGRRQALVQIAAGAAAMVAGPRVFAQSGWPDRTITIVTPFGAAVDILARLIAADIGPRLGANVIVEQRLGGSGTIGMAFVARAPADGYTLGMGTTTALTCAPLLMKNPGYDVQKSFTYLGLVQNTRQVLTVSPALGVNTVQEFIALAKSKPGQLNFGSSGVGNSIHLACELFNSATGIKAVHVPFKTGNETDAAIIGGQVQYTFAAVSSTLGMIQAGKIKPLAVTGETRDPALPNVITLREAGLPTRIPEQFYGLVAPAGVPPAITAKLDKAIAEMQANPAFQEQVRKLGGIPAQLNGEEFRKVVIADSQTWGGVIKQLNITLSS